MKIVIIEPLGIEKEMVEKISQENLPGHEIVYYETRVTDDTTLIERAKDADVLVAANLPLNRNVLSACPRLKLISVAFTGIDHLDVDYCKEKQIMICNSVGYSTIAVAEEVFGMIIGLYRHLLESDERTRCQQTKDGLNLLEMAGKTIGVVGAGEIGQRVIKIAQAFSLKVLCYSRTKRMIEGVEFVDLDTLMKESDIITLHIPATSATHHLINAEKIALMKKDAVLINTARGAIVDSQALAEALNQDRIAGAGIDVFEMEPPIPAEHPLLNAKNTLLAPHIGFATKEALVKRAHVVFENIKKYLAGDPQNIC
ncbi:NAD(P)-dependent oxidoreductase [Beduini massiliensis]|uniref:NAD(P)-dependent oxidoreductase n=1 Tax=Beduini massiliensis TaxID=1585974 RepID=UPI00059AB470|nr:NAD(P)-dependent oxidoreductase [Beduini massiliensis]